MTGRVDTEGGGGCAAGVCEVDCVNPQCVFCECESLRLVEFPDGVEFIGEGAFMMCEGMESVEIKREAFAECV